MNKIAFRTNAGKDIGYGHVFRCLALAKALCRESDRLDIVFIINEEAVNIIVENGFNHIVSNNLQNDIEIIKNLEADLVVFDSYLANNEYLKRVKKVSKLMLFDDNNDIYDSRIPNILLNGNIHAEDLAYGEDQEIIRLLGMKYLVMNEKYWSSPPDKPMNKEGVLITTGGSDVFNISPQILSALCNTSLLKKVVIGPGFSKEIIAEINSVKDSNTQLIIHPNGLKDYIATSEYVITASGSTVYEVLSQKTIPIIFSLAENQNRIYNYFEEAGVTSIGIYPQIKYETLPDAVSNSSKLDLSNLFNRVDGKGAIRVAKEIIHFMGIE